VGSLLPPTSRESEFCRFAGPAPTGTRSAWRLRQLEIDPTSQRPCPPPESVDLALFGQIVD
jgi:hypothetical protein